MLIDRPGFNLPTALNFLVDSLVERISLKSDGRPCGYCKGSSNPDALTFGVYHDAQASVGRPAHARPSLSLLFKHRRHTEVSCRPEVWWNLSVYGLSGADCSFSGQERGDSSAEQRVRASWVPVGYDPDRAYNRRLCGSEAVRDRLSLGERRPMEADRCCGTPVIVGSYRPSRCDGRCHHLPGQDLDLQLRLIFWDARSTFLFREGSRTWRNGRAHLGNQRVTRLYQAATEVLSPRSDAEGHPATERTSLQSNRAEHSRDLKDPSRFAPSFPLQSPKP